MYRKKTYILSTGKINAVHTRGILSYHMKHSLQNLCVSITTTIWQKHRLAPFHKAILQTFGQGENKVTPILFLQWPFYGLKIIVRKKNKAVDSMTSTFRNLEFGCTLIWRTKGGGGDVDEGLRWMNTFIEIINLRKQTMRYTISRGDPLFS